MHWLSGVSFVVDTVLPITLLIFAAKKKKNPRIWSIVGTIILVLLIIQGLGSPDGMIQSIVLGLIICFGMKITPYQKDALGSKNTSNQKKAHMRNDSKHPLLDQYKREHGM